MRSAQVRSSSVEALYARQRWIYGFLKPQAQPTPVYMASRRRPVDGFPLKALPYAQQAGSMPVHALETHRCHDLSAARARGVWGAAKGLAHAAG
jgi:hypothetical protein